MPVIVFAGHIGRHLENLIFYNIQNCFIVFLDPTNRILDTNIPIIATVEAKL